VYRATLAGLLKAKQSFRSRETINADIFPMVGQKLKASRESRSRSLHEETWYSDFLNSGTLQSL
jgi:hypothetical protein